jgi:hypothetical protein
MLQTPPCHLAADVFPKIQWLQQRMEAMIACGSALFKGELQQLQVKHSASAGACA